MTSHFHSQWPAKWFGVGLGRTPFGFLTASTAVVDLIATGALALGVRALACEAYRTTRADQRSFTMLAVRYPERVVAIVLCGARA
jgi:hypothetical protein